MSRRKPRRTDAMHDALAMDDVAGSVDRMALQTWLADQHAEVECTMLAGERWTRTLPAYAAPMVRAWSDEVARVVNGGANEKCIAAVKREARADVLNTVEELKGASPACCEAWAAWYPRWVRSVLLDLAEREPDLFQNDAQVVAARRDADAARKQRERDLALGADLFGWLHAQPNGVARWHPDKIARELAQRGPAPRVKPMAEALVRLGVATWKARPDGRPWALQVVCHSLPLH